MRADLVHLDFRGRFFCALLPVGFAYVACVLGRRPPAFTAWSDCLTVALSGPALYLLAGQYVLVPFTEHRRAFIWNGLLYAVPFFAALHFEWIGKLTGARFSLTARHLSQLTRNDGIMLGVAMLLFALLGIVCLREARRAGILRGYLIALFALAILVVLPPFLLGYRIHIHHYFWALSLVPFVRFQHPLCTIAQAFLAGIYVEGASRWGISPIWYPR